MYCTLPHCSASRFLRISRDFHRRFSGVRGNPPIMIVISVNLIIYLPANKLGILSALNAVLLWTQVKLVRLYFSPDLLQYTLFQIRPLCVLMTIYWIVSLLTSNPSRSQRCCFVFHLYSPFKVLSIIFQHYLEQFYIMCLPPYTLLLARSLCWPAQEGSAYS